jgi:hypothetical protein
MVSAGSDTRSTDEESRSDIVREDFIVCSFD